MSEPGNMIRLHLKSLERDVDSLAELRRLSKTEGGRLTDVGRDFLRFAKRMELKQSFVAKLLDITPGAVSQHYTKK